MIPRITCLLLLVLLPTMVNALGLGKLELKSMLGQRFEAKIPVIGATADDLDSLTIQLADNNAFARSNLSRPSILRHLKFIIIRSGDNNPDYVRIYSLTPIQDPFLSFLLEVNWSKGRLFRKYTVLLDPVTYEATAEENQRKQTIQRPVTIPTEVLRQAPITKPQLDNAPAQKLDIQPLPAVKAPAAVVAAPIPSTEDPVLTAPQTPAATDIDSEVAVHNEQPLTIAAVAPAHEVVYAEDFEQYQQRHRPQVTVPPPAPQPAAAAPALPKPTPATVNDGSYGDDSYGPTNKFDTLWAIAIAMRPDKSISINRMMLALFRANPHAFYRDNINALKRDVTLMMPTVDEINTLDNQQVLAEVKLQHAIWEEMKTGIFAKRTLPQQTASNSDTHTLAKTRASADPADDGSPKLKLVAVEDNANEGNEHNEDELMQDQLSNSNTGNELILAQETIQTMTQENLELTTKLEETELIIKDLERLLAVQDNELSLLQEQTAVLEEQVATTASAIPSNVLYLVIIILIAALTVALVKMSKARSGNNKPQATMKDEELPSVSVSSTQD